MRSGDSRTGMVDNDVQCPAATQLVDGPRDLVAPASQLALSLRLAHTGCAKNPGFWPTVLSVEPMVQYVVCLSVCLSVCL